MRELMLRFLQRSYPITRIKIQKHFKRTLNIDNNYYFLSNKTAQYNAYAKLFNILEIIFDENVDETKDVLKTFLHLK